MKLRRLAIQRLPGIDAPFAIDHLGDGFHVIVGPNGIGKSSLCRALRALLWKEPDPADRVAATALFEQDGELWAVERDGSRHIWQRDGADSDSPSLPAAYLSNCFFLSLRDLLDISADAGRTVATEIRLQMSGGFDLEGTAQSLFASASGSRFGRNEQKRIAGIDQEIRQAESGQGQLAAREAQLAELDARAAEAAVAQRRLGHYDLAIGIQDLRDELSQVKADLASLPEALARMTGTENKQIDQRGVELEKKCRLRSEAEGALEEAGNAAAATRLEEPLDPATLATWRGRADSLAEKERSLGDAREKLQGCQESVAEASRAVGGSGEATPTIDLAGDTDLFTFLSEASGADRARNVIDQRLRLLEGRALSDNDRRRLELLRQAVVPLRSWLRAPDPEVARDAKGRPLRKRLVFTVASLMGAGMALGIAIHPAFALLTAAGMGLALALWLIRSGSDAGHAREASRHDFPAGVEPPSSWTIDAVTQRLREMESALAELEAASMRARDRGVERADLENQRRDVEKQQSILEGRRQDLAARLGLLDIPPTAELVNMARALDQLRRTRVAERDAAARVEAIQEDHRSILLAIAGALTAHGEAEPSDAASARAGTDNLSRRSQDLREAQREQENARTTLGQLEGDISSIEGIIAGIYREAGLDTGDRAGLERLLADFERYSDLKIKRDGYKTSIGLDETKLASAGESDLAGRDRASLKTEKRHLEDQAGALEKLRGDIAEIRAQVDQAREGHSVEDLLAERSDALASLRDRQEEAMRAAAGRFLIEAVQREHETNQMPRVLERARNLFETFTHQAYELQVARDDAASFIAIKADTGIGQPPNELSDGTRAQLLLAARLAFAGEAEQGNRLPLFLDEALDHSDPVRFRAIARSLGRMVEDEGRQIFYLTNDPTDTRRIQEALKEEGCAPAEIIDLALVRGRAESVPGPDALYVEPLPGVPDPAGETPESYGAALRVPPLDPRREHIAQHLLYLLWDDLPLLHRLLENRIVRVGQWALLSRSRAALARRIKADGGTGAQLDARADLLEAFCRAWCEGRGRAVDREAIAQSDALSERYLDAVVEIARELDTDGGRLIEALRARSDKRLQGFRSRSADSLESYLVDEGYVDSRPILEESDIVARAMAIPAARNLPEQVVARSLHLWWNLCTRDLSDRN